MTIRKTLSTALAAAAALFAVGTFAPGIAEAGSCHGGGGGYAAKRQVVRTARIVRVAPRPTVVKPVSVAAVQQKPAQPDVSEQQIVTGSLATTAATQDATEAAAEVAASVVAAPVQTAAVAGGDCRKFDPTTSTLISVACGQ